MVDKRLVTNEIYQTWCSKFLDYHFLLSFSFMQFSQILEQNISKSPYS
jgi:hypothetical protein